MYAYLTRMLRGIVERYKDAPVVLLDLCALGHPAVVLATRARVYGDDDLDLLAGGAALVRLRAVPQVQEEVLRE